MTKTIIAVACCTCLVSAAYAAMQTTPQTEPNPNAADQPADQTVVNQTAPTQTSTQNSTVQTHMHPADNAKVKKMSAPPSAKTMGASDCLIMVDNKSFEDIRVYGRFDDGLYLEPFTIKKWEDPHYISLFYNGYCHGAMDFYIDTVGDTYKYSGFTPVGKKIRIGW